MEYVAVAFVPVPKKPIQVNEEPVFVILACRSDKE